MTGDHEGYTFDAERNEMVHRLDGWARTNQARLRFDRFFVRPQYYSCKSCVLVGTMPLPLERENNSNSDKNAGGQWWPSDHFGLLLTLEESKAPAKNAENQCAIS